MIFYYVLYVHLAQCGKYIYFNIFLLLTEIMAGIMPGVSLLSKSHVSLLSRSLSTTSVSQVSWEVCVETLTNTVQCFLFL
jgi:hypothetical protein